MWRILQLALFVISMMNFTWAAFTRSLSPPQYNPDCNGLKVCSSPIDGKDFAHNLVVTKSSCSTDNLFFVWSTIGAPSLTLIRTAPEGEVTVDWSGMQDGVDSTPLLEVSELLSSSAYVLTALWKCSTSNPDATTVKIPLNLKDCEPDKLSRTPLDDLKWYNNSHTIAKIGSSDAYLVSFRSDEILNGTLQLQMTFYNSEGRENTDDTGLTNSLHSGNTTQFQVSLEGFSGSETARYSMEHLFLKANEESSFQYTSKQGLNDQYTPGVFEYDQFNAVNSSATANSVDQLDMFFGWKKGSYKDPKLDLNNLVALYYDTPLGDIVPKTSDEMETNETSVALEYFSGTLQGDYSYIFFNMTFGSSDDDDGYDNYLAWEGQVGYGSMKYDGLSALIISITVVGFALPSAIIVFGWAFVFLMKRKRFQQYNLMQEEIHKKRGDGDRTNYTDDEQSRAENFNYRQM